MLRSSSELLRIDSASPIFVDEDEELQRRQYVTPLSPRLQTAGSTSGTAESQQQQKRSSGGSAAASSVRARIGPGQTRSPSSPTREAPLIMASDLSDPSTAASKGPAYRRYEREVELLQQQRDASGSNPMGSFAAYRPGAASSAAVSSRALSTTTSLPLHTDSSSTDVVNADAAAPHPSTGQATPTNKRAKRVSLGQVSIDGVPVITIDSATTESIGHARSQVSSGSRQRASSGSSPAVLRDGVEKSRRRRTMTDSYRNSAVLSTLRERRQSDPTNALDTTRSASASRGSAEEGRRRSWLVGGGRTRQSSEGQAVGRGRNRIVGGASRSLQSTTADALLNTSPQRSAAMHHDLGSTSNTTSPRLAAASIMRWDAAQSTALSLQRGDGSAVPMRKLSNETGRYSTPSEVVSHNRLAAHRHLNALNALRARIPLQPSTSLRPLRYQSILARVHHRTLIFQTYLHVPVTIFLDFSALFTLVQIAAFPDANASGAAWWIASGVYAGCFLAWLIGVVIAWEGVVEYRRRWVSTRPFALPIYLSAPAFNLTAIQSFSLYSLLYRARLSASRRDFVLESFWFYGQNWPTVLLLIPRGIILAVVLVLYKGTGGGSGTTRQPLAGQTRDPVYFANDTSLLTTFAFTVLVINAAWMAWRLLALLVAWIGLAMALGPRWMFRREAAYYQSDESDVSMSEMGYHAASRSMLNLSRTSDVARERGGDGAMADGASTRAAAEMAERQTAPMSAQAQQRDDLNGAPLSAGPSATVQPAVRDTDALVTPQSRQSEEPMIHLPRWAWRQRAEERINGLLYQCHIMINEEESNNGQGQDAPSPQRPQRHRASLYDPEAAMNIPRRGGSLDTNKERRRRKDAAAITSLAALPLADDPLITSTEGGPPLEEADRLALTSPVPAAPSTFGGSAVQPTQDAAASQNALKEKMSDGGISASSYPFPRRSQDTSVPSAAATVYTATRMSPMRSDSRSVVASVSSGAAADADHSTPVLESSAMSREHRSNETVRQEKPSGGPSVKQEERLTWWTGLWAGSSSRKRDSPSEGTSLKSLPATPPREKTAVQSEAGNVQQAQLPQVMRVDSPLSGMRTDRTRDVADSNGSHERGEIKSEGHTTLSHADDVEDNESSTGGHSATTEDSEERRIWAAFPEQSRRHPPGLIALEMQQRRLEKEREEQQRRRSGQQRRWSNEDDESMTLVTPPLPSTSRHSPRFTTSLSVVEDESTDVPLGQEAADTSAGDGEGGGGGGGSDSAADTPYDPTGNVVSGSPADEGLGMIQEESWSSGLATEDDELERLRGSGSHDKSRET